MEANVSDLTEDEPVPKTQQDQGHDNRVFADEAGLPHLARPTNNAETQQYRRTMENSRL